VEAHEELLLLLFRDEQDVVEEEVVPLLDLVVVHVEL
jgi:hypothetical protein